MRGRKNKNNKKTLNITTLSINAWRTTRPAYYRQILKDGYHRLNKPGVFISR